MEQNLTAFAKFRDQLKGQIKFANGDEKFTGRVIYKFKGKTLSETLEITIRLTTFEYGQISINEGGSIKALDVHLGFSHQFQKYTYSEDGFLTIDGKSPQLGNYEVKITQV